ncbi:MAG TPA: hypothetical protein VG268_04440, partial [Streptosporangiaceae bacterium]|nr:hypothetical protein [Streptosporangiaceae bacterium]
ADYGMIREENIARYGWDTAVLDLLGHLYSDRTHFIFELIQNAEDAGATGLSFTLHEDRLEVRHDGRPFTEADVRGVCGVAQSSKSADLTQIGQFGIGFKSVYAYTRNPRIYSAGERFRIESYVRPFALDPDGPGDGPGDGPDTLFVFPFDLDSVPAPVAVAEIAAALNTLEPATLLFLRHLGRLRVSGTGVTAAVLARTGQPGPAAAQRVSVSKNPGSSNDSWLVWSRPLPGHRGPRHDDLTVQLAFRAGPEQLPRISPLDRSPLSVFFPTEKETFLGFVAQGPYRTTPARDNVPEHDPANLEFVRETAVLLTGVLGGLRDAGLLTVAALTALPLDPARFPPGSMFRPLFDAVRTALAGQALIPAADGEPRVAGELAVAASPGLAGLLGPDQLGALYGEGGPLFFADPGITPEDTPVLWRYLRDELGLPEVTAAGLVTRAGPDFLAAQPDAWLARYYAFLHTDTRLWRAPADPGEPPAAARTQPIIRLEDGRQVPAFDADGHPAVYLPDPLAPAAPARRPALATVRRPVAADPAARRFLAALGLTEPDRVAAVLDGVLPRYDGLDLADLDPAQHSADLEYVARTLDEAAPADRERLLERLAGTAFLIGENAATGEPRLRPPSRLYQRSKELETYFDGNPGAWFARDTYGPWLVQLRDMGVRQDVQLTARAPGPTGYVVIVVDFGRNERGLDGFDPAAELDGLAFALRHPSHALAEYVWNNLLSPNRQLIAGVVERSVLMSFADATRETVTSAIGVAAAEAAWLPHPDGTYRRPDEVSLDDLPPTYTRDEALAQALGMPQPVVSLAARRLGVPPAVLWGLSAHPDLVELVERELEARDGQ